MTIVIDAMGGDNAPQMPVAGAVKARRENGINVTLVGDQQRLQKQLDKYGLNGRGLELIHADEVIEMSDSVTEALRRKRDSSMRVCFDLLKTGEAAGVVSAGHSGAMLAIGHFVSKTLPGINRPCISVLIPSRKDKVLLVDAGANTDCSPENLLQFAILGSIYREEAHQLKHPKIGLLNIGTEAGKGDTRSRKTYHLLQESGLNFVGNVEGKAFFQGNVDVVVTDGFAGNIFLKSIQGAAAFVKLLFQDEIEQSYWTRFGAFFIKRSLNRLKKLTDYREFGGAPLLGLRANAVVCHGSSDDQAIANGIRMAQWAEDSALIKRLEEAVILQQEQNKEIA